MKKVLTFLGIIFGVLLLLLGGYFFYFFTFVQPAIDEESKAWVDQIVPEITTTWDSQKLIENGSKDFLALTSENKIQNLITQLRTELGPLQSYDGSQGEAGVTIHNFSQNTIAEYVADIEFEKADAQIFIQGIKEDGKWKIRNFHVNIKDTQE